MYSVHAHVHNVCKRMNKVCQKHTYNVCTHIKQDTYMHNVQMCDCCNMSTQQCVILSQGCCLTHNTLQCLTQNIGNNNKTASLHIRINVGDIVSLLHVYMQIANIDLNLLLQNNNKKKTNLLKVASLDVRILHLSEVGKAVVMSRVRLQSGWKITTLFHASQSHSVMFVGTNIHMLIILGMYNCICMCANTTLLSPPPPKIYDSICLS